MIPASPHPLLVAERLPVPKFIIVVLALLSGLIPAQAFLPNPDLLTISPAFARAGTTVEVTIAGTDLDETRTLRFADERIRVEPVTTPADEFFPEPLPVLNRFRVTLPPDLPPGVYEVRSLGYFGLSTARPFLVVEPDAAEIAEESSHASPETALPVALNSGVTGLVDSRAIDWYRFPARRGERILIQAWAERIDSRADVVLNLTDAAGRELESSRAFFGRDPLVDFTPPADGDYFLAVSDSLYRGGAQYFYRLELSRSAHLDFVFPPAALPGTTASFTFHGRNLPGGSLGEGLVLNGKPIETLDLNLEVPAAVTVPGGIFPDTPRRGLLPGFEHRIAGSNPVRIGFATAPVVLETRGDDIQTLDVPCEVAGRFGERGDSDTYRFQAAKGQTWWIEVISERMGAMTDPWLLVEKVTGNDQGGEKVTRVADNDDPPTFYGPDALDDLNADTLDPALSFTADEDATYQVTLLNQSSGGSIAHLYRLAIREAQPDFQLISGTERTKTINNDAYPAAPLLRRNGSMVYRILALRRDGFEGDITVRATGLPEGVTAADLVLTGDSREGFLALQAAPDAKAWSGPVRITGTATIGDQSVEREARSASIVWGNRVFANQRQIRSRLDQENVLSVIDSETEPCRIGPAEAKVWTVELKQKLEIPIRISDTGTRKGNLEIEAFGFPGLLRSPPTVTVKEGQPEATLVMDFTPNGNFKVAPGTFQFVLQGIGNTSYVQNPAAVDRAKAELARLQELSSQAADEAKKARDATTVEGADAEAAKQALAAAEAKAKQAEALAQAADKALQAATAAAKEKTSQFATYSLPITVTVTAASP